MTKGETIAYTDLQTTGRAYNYSGYPTFYNDYDSFLLTSSNTSAVRISNSAHTLTAADPGTATVTVQCRDCTTSCTFQVNVISYAGTYYLRNVGSDGYLEPYSSYVRTGTFSGTNVQRWEVTLRSGGYYSIKDVQSNKYLSILNDSTSANAQATTLSTYSGTSGQQFKIIGNDSGYLTIKPRCGEGNGYVLGVSFVSGGYYAGQGVLTSGGYGEWQLISYGNKSFNDLDHDTTLYQLVNCHGYAMQINDWPENWTTEEDAVLMSLNVALYLNNSSYRNTIYDDLSEALYNDFTNWLDANDYTYSPEGDFSGNGESKVIQSNQYRVVARCGLQIFYDSNTYYPVYDYHFWYQTYDGRWANKHGEEAPDHLLLGVTPFSTNTDGWQHLVDNFYDGAIYSFIITG